MRFVLLIFCPHIPSALLPGACLSSFPCPCLVCLCNWCRYVNSLPVAYRPSEERHILTYTRARGAIHVSCVQWSWWNHHKTWLCTKNHVQKLEKAIPETKADFVGVAWSHRPLFCPPRTAPSQQLNVTACQCPTQKAPGIPAPTSPLCITLRFRLCPAFIFSYRSFLF